MDISKAQELAKECGYEIAEPIDVSKLSFRQIVRDMCNPDACPTGFDKSWSCPPAVASVEEYKEIAQTYSQGIAVQTVGHMEDSFDFETIAETSIAHKEKFVAFIEKMRSEADDKIFPMGAGSCPLCSPCTYPDNPCIQPDKKIVSMEACGLLVNQVCTENGLLYNHGEKTICYTSCCLF